MQLNSEQQKKHQEAISAGRKAYRALIPVTGNPYPKTPYRDLWDKGWRIERKKDDAVRPPRDPKRLPFKKTREFTSNTEKRRYDRSSTERNSQRTETKPVVSVLIERFNRPRQARA